MCGMGVGARREGMRAQFKEECSFIVFFAPASQLSPPWS